MATDYLSRESVFEAFAPFCKDCRFSDNEKNCECCPHGPAKLKLNAIPAADVVSSECFNRILAENDTMREQFASIGKKPVDSMEDAERIETGEWEIDSDNLPVCPKCGEIALQRIFCKVPHLIMQLQMVKSKYCPNCGAKLNGRTEYV